MLKFVWMLVLSVICVSVTAADVIVNVRGIKTAEGEIGVRLFDDEKAFPTKATDEPNQWVRADVAGVQFRFEGVKPGVYAISASHDLNGNRKVDTTWVGMPKEPWGVSNNVRPGLRAPRFKEAKFEVTGDGPVVIDIEVDK